MLVNPGLQTAFQGFLVAIAALLMAIGAILAKVGLDNTTAYNVIMIVGGTVVGLGGAIWAVYASIVNLLNARAVAAHAGINLALSGRALDENGNPITRINSGAVPLGVTVRSGTQIVKNFGPPE